MSQGQEPAEQEDRRAIVRDSLGVGLATGLYGVSFGAVSVGAGLSVAQTCVLSLLMFTGASQFALVGVVPAAGRRSRPRPRRARHAQHALRPPARAAAGFRGRQRLGAAHLLIDESTAMSVTRTTRCARVPGHRLDLRALEPLHLPRRDRRPALGDPRTYGLDAAVGGAFLALLWPQLGEPRNRVVAVLAVAVALGIVPVAPAGVPVLAAGGVALLVGLLSRGTE